MSFMALNNLRRVIPYFVLLVLVAGNFAAFDVRVARAAFDGGDGSMEDPFQISTCQQLQDISDDLLASYLLVDDIDCSATNPEGPWDSETWPGDNGFSPIGDWTNRFVGVLDGDGHTITGLYIDRPGTPNVGLFGVIDVGEAEGSGQVRDLHLVDVDVTGYDLVGAIAGGLAGRIQDSSASGTVNGVTDVGGLVGQHVSTESMDNSSPLVYTWNGEGYTYTDDVGALLPKTLNGIDVAQIDSEDLSPKDGKYSMRIAEEYNEIVYYDELAFMTFDHQPGYSVVEPLNRSAGVADLRTVSDNPTHPLVSCVDNEGNDCLGALSSYDDQWSYENEDGQYDTKNLNKSWILDFGDLSGASDVELVLRGARDYVASSEYPGNSARSIQVKDADGNWVEIYRKSQLGSDGSPRLRTIDLTGKFLTDDYRVKVVYDTFNANYFAVDTSAQVPFTTQTYHPDSVELGFHGFTDIDRTYFSDHTYDQVSDEPKDLFAQQYGNFTKYGDVTPLLGATDDQFAVMRYGDQLSVEFPFVAPEEGMERSFMLFNNAYYKHATKDGIGDLGRTVTPLPYAGMSSYDASTEYPMTPENQEYLDTWNTRVYDGVIGHGGSTIVDSYANVDVTGTGSNVGGLVGRNNKEIYGSYATGGVEGTYWIGGLVGLNLSDGTIHDSYATGSVLSEYYSGGLVGRNYGSVSDSYASGSVEGTDYLGGLIGIDQTCGECGVLNSFSVGDVTSAADPSYVGGFIGEGTEWDYASSGNYWKNNLAEGVGDRSDGANEAESTEWFQGNSTNAPLDSWDFEGIWVATASSYPTFIAISADDPIPSDFATVETGDVDASRTGATFNGAVLDVGIGEVSERGFEYGLTAEYGLSASEFSGEGFYSAEEYSLDVSGLTCRTEYFFRAFVVNGEGTSYGDDVPFSTAACQGGSAAAPTTYYHGDSGTWETTIPDAPETSESSDDAAPAEASVEPETDSSSDSNVVYDSNAGRNEAVASGATGPSPYTGTTEELSHVSAGWYVRGEHYDTVYYVDADLHRHPFWNATTFFTWADSWDEVVWVTDATLATLPMDTLMLPAPRTILVKVQSDPRVFFVVEDDVIRYVPDESTAAALFGSDWSDYVVDYEATAFAHFTVGDDMSGADVVDVAEMKTRAELAARAT